MNLDPKALALLQALQEGPGNGPALIGRIQARRGAVLDTAACCLLLLDLEGNGLITGESGEPKPGKRARRVYRLTADGKLEVERAEGREPAPRRLGVDGWMLVRCLFAGMALGAFAVLVTMAAKSCRGGEQEARALPVAAGGAW